MNVNIYICPKVLYDKNFKKNINLAIYLILQH